MQINIIGTGTMGSAIAKILAQAGQKVFVYDRDFKKAQALARQPKIFAKKDVGELSAADFIIIAVKPQDIAGLKIKIHHSTILVSIAAGVTIGKLKKLFRHQKIVRVMPNLGLSVGLGIAAWKSAGLSAKEKAATKKLLNKITENFEVKNEAEINAVTAISGSGPAYFFYLAEALQKAAKSLGFNEARSRQLVEKTFSASAALQKNADYSQLINKIASKKGTTEAALAVFEKHHLPEIIKQAVKSAQKRAAELSN